MVRALSVSVVFRSGVIEAQLVNRHPELLSQGANVPLAGTTCALLPSAERTLRYSHPPSHGGEREKGREKLGPLFADLPNPVHDGKRRASFDRKTRQFSSGMVGSTERYQFATLVGMAAPMTKPPMRRPRRYHL